MLDADVGVELAVTDRDRHADIAHAEAPRTGGGHGVVHPAVDASRQGLPERVRDRVRKVRTARERFAVHVGERGVLEPAVLR